MASLSTDSAGNTHAEPTRLSDATRMANVECHAPMVSMDFGTMGEVQACCFNVLYPLGNVSDSTLDEIWHSERAQRLRAAVADGDLSLGCGMCARRARNREAEHPWEIFDWFRPDANGGWPQRLAFALSNRCNLACSMCGPDRSSTIRARRADLTPLRSPYGDAFFEQLEPYLEHGVFFDFNGGEPLLIPEHHRVWDLLARINPGAKISLTTNGTVAGRRLDWLRDTFDLSLRISIDGFTRRTFETIRVGADFDAVVANIEDAAARALEGGNRLDLSWCVIRNNWFEFADAAMWAESIGARLDPLVVAERDLGLHHLPREELQAIAEVVAAQAERITPHLALNADTWKRFETMIRAAADGDVDDSAYLELLSQEELSARLASPPPPPNRGDEPRALQRFGHDAWIRIALDRSGAIESLAADGPARDSLHPTLARWAAEQRSIEPATAFTDLAERFGGTLWVMDRFDTAGERVHTWLIGRPDRSKEGVIVRVAHLGTPTGAQIDVAVADFVAPNRTPVSISNARSTA